ncbi:hypothetical protein SDC9_212656 [bioreactor metagenome]|uniref:Uncharacterized protein n=1 Tax=bioreactor metagenome TaxID=1076179 RepID=A0A645JMJ5_9ZZZZ
MLQRFDNDGLSADFGIDLVCLQYSLDILVRYLDCLRRFSVAEFDFHNATS